LASGLHGENNQEHYHIYTGNGRNGKSKFQDLINYTFGDYFSQVPVQLLTRPQGDSEKPNVLLVSLKAKRMVMASEPQKDEHINVAFVKQITGGDSISCRKNNSNHQISYKPQFQLIMLCNDIPTAQFDEAFYKRSRIIHFPTTFISNPNPQMKHEKLVNESLSNELPLWKNEFLLLLLEYYQMYKNAGKKLYPPERVKILVNKYRIMSDPVSQWFKQATKESEYHYSFQGLWNHYQSWFSRNFSRKDMAKLNINDFKSALKKLVKFERAQCKDTGNKQTAVMNRDVIMEDEVEDSCSDSSTSDDDSDDSDDNDGSDYEVLSRTIDNRLLDLKSAPSEEVTQEL
jgi:P4 family phage/plasmid primase-like protien